VGDAAPASSPFARALDAVHLLALSFFLAVALAALARGDGGAGIAVPWYAALLVATAALAAAARRPGAGRVLGELHLGSTILILPAVFTGLRWLAPAATGLPHPIPIPVPATGRQFDGTLEALDRSWFGLDVARWSEGFLTAPVADLFMAFYALYFLMPVALLVVLRVRGDRAVIYRTAFTIAAGVHACYMLYLLVPTVGPRHAYVDRSLPLPEGLWTGALHDFIRDGEPQPFDAFPSCHVILGILCAILSWPVGGAFRWAMAVAGVGTAISTVVLRYHYLVDDLAGLAVVAAALGAAALLDRRIARKAAAGPHGDRMGEMLGGGGAT
jgi:membrane-associated phospholipid phosphatase